MRRRVRTGWCWKRSICWWWRCKRRWYCNKTISSGNSAWMKLDLGQISIYFWIHHTFLVTSEKFGQTFLSTISQSLKDGSLWREYESEFDSISKQYKQKAYEVTKPMIILNRTKPHSRLGGLLLTFWHLDRGPELANLISILVGH